MKQVTLVVAHGGFSMEGSASLKVKGTAHACHKSVEFKLWVNRNTTEWGDNLPQNKAGNTVNLFKKTRPLFRASRYRLRQPRYTGLPAGFVQLPPTPTLGI